MKIEGCKVVDAKRRLAVKITKADTLLGKRGDPTRCAAAVALLRENKGLKGARVQVSKTYIKKGNVWVRYRTPSRLKLELISFDRGAPARHSEGWFDLLPPTDSDKLGQGKYNTQVAKLRRERKPKPRVAHRRVDGVRTPMR